MQKNKTIVIGTLSAILLAGTTQAFFGQGCTISGDCSAQVNTSRTATTTVLECGTGRMRGLNNYTAKCAVKQTRKGIARDRTSRILQREAPRYRGSVESSEVPTAKAENMIQKAWRILKEKREAKKLINTQ